MKLVKLSWGTVCLLAQMLGKDADALIAKLPTPASADPVIYALVIVFSQYSPIQPPPTTFNIPQYCTCE